MNQTSNFILNLSKLTLKQLNFKGLNLNLKINNKDIQELTKMLIKETKERCDRIVSIKKINYENILVVIII
jgi:hypothetical protein